MYELESSKLDVNRDNLQNGEVFEDPANMSLTPNGAFPSPLLSAEFSADAKFNAVSPKIGLTYKASEDVFLFTHVTRGYRPGGLNQFIDEKEAAEFDPEFSLNYELGLKSTWLDNKVRINLTAFRITWEDQQLFTIVDDMFSFGIENLGESTSTGLELESQFLPFKGFSLTANVGFLSTEITNFKVVGLTGSELDFKGNDQAYSPQWNGNLAINYDYKINEHTTFFMGMDYIFQSQMYFDPENILSQEAYGLVNARLGASYKKIEITIKYHLEKEKKGSDLVKFKKMRLASL